MGVRMMQISQHGLDFIAGFEGGQSADGLFHSYWDPNGHCWTVGFGQTSGVHQGMTWTKAQAENDLRSSIARHYLPAIEALGVPLTQNQLDALASFVWNLGVGSMQWDVGRYLRQRNYQAAANAMLQYDHAGGQRLAGLTRRRQAERALFLTAGGKPARHAPHRPHRPPGPRVLHLTSPLMRGQDIARLQRALNAQGAHITVDGQYGPGTEHAVGQVAWQLGLGHTNALPAIQRVIENPHLRSPMDHRRAKQRAAAAKKAGHGLAGILRYVEAHLGVHEHPAGSNWGAPYPEQWLRDLGLGPAPWCGALQAAAIHAAGGHVTARCAYCPYIEQDAKAGANGFERWTSDHRDGVEPGWQVLYCWNGTGVPEHVGTVKALGANGVTSAEGNTGGSNPADGGMVAIETRPYSLVVGYAKARVP